MKKELLFILLFCSHGALSQMPATSNWVSLQLLGNVSDKWQWTFDGGYRTLGMSVSSYGYHSRGGIRYSFNKVWSAAAGTAFFFTRSSYQKSNHQFGREFRLWQELGAHTPLSGSILLYNRFRTEERWFAAVNGRDAFFGFRLRERLTGTIAITKKWNLEFGDEYMRMFAQRKFMFNSNRIILWAFYKMKKEAQLQVGYLWMKLPVSSQHIFSLAFQKNLSARGKKLQE